MSDWKPGCSGTIDTLEDSIEIAEEVLGCVEALEDAFAQLPGSLDESMLEMDVSKAPQTFVELKIAVEALRRAVRICGSESKTMYKRLKDFSID